MRMLALLALRQLAANRVLIAVLALGVVVASSLLAIAPIYARSMSDLGLTYVIQSETRGQPTTQVQLQSVPLRTAEGTALRDTVERRIGERIGWFSTRTDRITRLGRFIVMKDPVASSTVGLPLGEPYAIGDAPGKVRATSGRLPAPAAGITEVALQARAAQLAGLQLGDRFMLRESFDNCERELPTDPFPPPPPPCPLTASVTFDAPAVLVGIVEPIDPSDAAWAGSADRNFVPYVLPIDGAGPILPMLADESALFDSFGARYPAYPATFTWTVEANPSVLTRTNYERARDDLVGLGAELQQLRGYAVSPLRDTLTGFGKTASYQQTPLTILLLEITGIALFYVGLVAALVAERQADEIALLRGRGATLVQVAWVYAVQGLAVAIPALFAAPFIAGAATALLGLTPLFEDVSSGELLPVTIVPLSFGLAAIGAALSLVALVVPALVMALRGPGRIRRGLSRPSASVVQRYYLDLVLAAAAALLLWELRERGSVFTPSASGSLSDDPLLLISPALAIIAVGAVLMRAYPWLLRLVSWAVRPVAGPALALGLWQVVRNPGQYTRLALLLTMAVAVGTFAASYTQTADRSYRDRANYEAGADLRAAAGTANRGLDVSRGDLEAAVTSLRGVTDATTLVRTRAGVAGAGSSSDRFQVLAVDPAAAGRMLWSRDDFAARPLPDLLRDLGGQPALPGLPLPQATKTISAWARLSSPMSGMTLWAGIRDAGGRFGLVELGGFAAIGDGWTRLSGDVTKSSTVWSGQLSLVSLMVTGQPDRPTTPVLFVDDISVEADSGAVFLEGFEGGATWSAFPSAAQVPDVASLSNEQPHGGRQAIRLQLRQGVTQEVRGLYLNTLLTPLPVVVSSSFVAQTGAGKGATALLSFGGGTLVPIVVRDTFDLFPTAPTKDGPVVIFNRDRLLAWADMSYGSVGTTLEVDEAWLSLAPSADEAALTTALDRRPIGLSEITSRRALLAANTENPLIAASGSGILSLAFWAVLALVVVAALTSLIAALRRRSVELAVVRALGLTGRQLFAMLVLEYGLVVALGIAAGTVTGRFVSDRMLSFLDVTENGDRVEPSFILQTTWLLVLAGAALVVVAVGLALLLAARRLARRPTVEVLRAE